MARNDNKIKLFLISFILAVLLWMVATAQSDPMAYARLENIPISFENTNELEENGLSITSSTERTLKIRIYGRSMQIKKLSNDDIKASVDFSDVKSSGEYKLYVQIEGLEEDIAIVEQSPKRINVKVEEASSSGVNKPIFTQVGDMPSGFSVLSMESDVEDVYLTGSSEQIGKVNKVIGKVDVTGREDDFSVTTELLAVDKDNEEVDDVEVNPSVAEVYVKVGNTKEIKVNPVITGKVKDGYRITSIKSSVDTITVVGKRNDLESLDVINTKSINVNNKTKSIEKKVKFDLPDNIIVKDDIKSTNVIISIDKNNEKTVNISSFTFKGLQDDLAASVLDDRVGVVFSGDDDALAKIDESYLTGTLDVTGLDVGTYSLNINISTKELPKGVTIKSVNKETVKVQIENKKQSSKEERN